MTISDNTFTAGTIQLPGEGGEGGGGGVEKQECRVSDEHEA